MTAKRKQHTAAFKTQVALTTLKGDQIVNELAGQFQVHPTLIHAWKKQLLQGAEALFTNGVKAAEADQFKGLYGRLRRFFRAPQQQSKHFPEELFPTE